MTEQEENEQIAERLLGWERVDSITWRDPHGSFNGEPVPAFTTWAEAGLILDALADGGHDYIWRHDSLESCPYQFEINKRHSGRSDCGPQAIRAAALRYIRASREVGAKHD